MQFVDANGTVYDDANLGMWESIIHNWDRSQAGVYILPADTWWLRIASTDEFTPDQYIQLQPLANTGPAAYSVLTENPHTPTFPSPAGSMTGGPVYGTDRSPYVNQVVGHWEWQQVYRPGLDSPPDNPYIPTSDQGYGWVEVDDSQAYINWLNANPVGGGGFDLGAFIASAAVGTLIGASVAGTTGETAAGNLVTGQDVNANLGAAAALDVMGAGVVAGTVALGAEAAAPATSDATVIVEPAADTGGALTVGPTAPSLDGIGPAGLDLPPPAEDLSGAVAPTDFPASATTPDLGGVASMPSAPSAVASSVSSAATAAKGVVGDLTTIAGATATAKALFGAVQSARTGSSQVATTQSTAAAAGPSSAGGLAVDYSSMIKSLSVPVLIVLGAKLLL